MTQNTKILLEVKNSLIQNFGENITDVILFGSRVQGNFNEHSDYDILVILKNNYDYKFENKILESVLDIVISRNKLIDIHLISEEELTSLKGKQSFYQNALASGIHA